MNLLLLLGCGSEISTIRCETITRRRYFKFHTEGNIGGIDLSDIGTVQEWGPVIAHVTENRSMPPWSGVGDFSNDWSLSDDQIAMVQQWVDADMPLGDAGGDTVPVEMIGTTLSRVDTSLSMPESYVVATDSGDGIVVLCWIGKKWVLNTLLDSMRFQGTQRWFITSLHFLCVPTLLGDSIFDSLQEWEQTDDRQGYFVTVDRV